MQTRSTRRPAGVALGDPGDGVTDRQLVHRLAQQIRGSCSPSGRSMIRLAPSAVRAVTTPGCSAVTVPMIAAPAPAGARGSPRARRRRARRATTATKPALVGDLDRVETEEAACRLDLGSGTGIARSSSSIPDAARSRRARRRSRRGRRASGRAACGGRRRRGSAAISVSRRSSASGALSERSSVPNSSPSRTLRTATPCMPIGPLTITRSPGQSPGPERSSTPVRDERRSRRC